MNYIVVLFATVLLAFEFALSKQYQTSEGTTLSAGLKFNVLSGLFTAIIFFGISGFHAEFSLFSVILAFFQSLCAIAYSIIGFQVLKNGNMAIYSIFLMSGGMLLPYIFGVLFLKEPLTPLRVSGVIIILLAVVFSNKAKYTAQVSLYLLGIAVFVLNGLVSILSKCHQINTTFIPVSSTAFVMYTGIGKFISSFIVLLFCKKDCKQLSISSKNTFFIVLCSALISGISYMLQLIGAKGLPATVLYPIVTGGSIIFSTLSGMIFFKDPPSCYQLIGIVLCFIGTLLFL